MIPKVIHYCWFGGNEKSDKILHCINSWKLYLPDYEIIEWNESNFDINYNEFTRTAHEAKRWAFVSDVARLWALHEHGGIYMDTDVEVYQSLNCFLDNPAFTGFENVGYPVTAVMGSVKGNKLIKVMLDYYKDEVFTDDHYTNLITNTTIMSNIFEDNGIDRWADVEQRNSYITIYPKEYFCNYGGEINGNTYARHHMFGSWGY